MRIEDVAEWELIKTEGDYKLYLRQVVTNNLSTGIPQWVYTIDSKWFSKTGYRQSNKETALQQGLEALQTRINEIETDMEMYEKL